MVAIVSTTTDRTFIFPPFADLSFGEVDPIEILMESLFRPCEHARIPSSFGDVSAVSFVSMAYASGVASSDPLMLGRASIIMVQVAVSKSDTVCGHYRRTTKE